MNRLFNYASVCLLLSVLFTPMVVAQNFPVVSPEAVGFSSERLERLDTRLNEYIKTGYIPGAVVLLARDGNVFYKKSFGYRDLKVKDPMEIDDIFRIASMTKPIIATATMMLFEEGAFLLTDPISKYIPEFANPKVTVPVENPAPGEARTTTVPAKSEITIYHLLTHTSGISYGGPAYSQAGVQNGIFPGTGVIKENILKLAPLPLMHQPGEKFTYGLNDDVLGYLIEVIAGMPLDEFMRTRMFEPLKMNDTFFFVPENKLNRLAGLYQGDRNHILNPDSKQPAEEPRTLFSGGAGLRSTAGDYMRFAQMILNGGELDGVRLLSPKTVAIMTTNQIGELNEPFNDNAGDKYGFGFGIRTVRGPLASVESLGILDWDGAHATRFWIDPEEKLVGMFMTQISSGEWRVLNLTRNLVYQALLEPKASTTR